MNRYPIRARNLLATAAILASPALSAHAQEQVAQSSSAAQQAQSIGDIVVTAQRRAERLQDVPIAISAFSADTLQNQGVVNTKDLTLVTPGLNFTQSSYSPQPTIRGIGTRGVSASEESVVPVYVDGVYQPFLASTVFDLSNVERVEVLRGPQTALYGRNSTGGAINIITLTPTVEPYMKASVSYGRFDELIAKAWASMGSELVQVGIGGLIRYDEGYIDDLYRGGKVGWSRSKDLRGKVRLTPSDDIELILSRWTTRHSDTLSSRAQPYRDNTAARRVSPATYVSLRPRQTDSTTGELKSTQDTVSLTGKFGLGGVNLTSITAYDHSTIDIFADVDASRLDLSSLPTNSDSESWIQELYAVSDNDSPLQWIFGGTYFWRDAGSKNSRVLAFGVPVSNTTGKQITKAFAVYGQGTYQFSDRFSAILAGRYTVEKKEHSFRDNLTGGTTAEKRTFKDFSPSATVQYDFSRSANIYARAGKGFKSGLYATTTPSYAIDTTGQRVTNSVAPEKVWQYELGTKLALSSGISGNLAAFYTKYNNIQVNVRPDNISRLQNAGAADIYGFEGEIVVEPVRKLSLRFGFTKLWGEFKDFKDAIGYTPRLNAAGNPVGGNDLIVFDASGKTIIRTPLYTLSGGLNYEAELANGAAATFSLTAFHAGKEYRDADNRVALPAYTVVNGEIGYRFPDSRVKVSLWGRNLFNETYNLYILTGGTADSTVYAAPRTYGVRLNFEFGG